MTTGTLGTPKKRAAFLAALATGLSVAGAAKAAGIPRRSAYNWKEADPDFAALWDAALEEGTEVLEDEARRRAVEGVTREHSHYHLGTRIGTDIETKYSDTLLIFLLKARNPKKYQEQSKVELGGSLVVERVTFAEPDTD